MAGTARQISVVVDADSKPLQVAVGKAADSLKALGEALVKQQGAALKGGDQTIKSNAAVADSYARMSGTVRGSVLEVVQSIQTQMAEQAKAADGAVRASQITTDAMRRNLAAYAEAGDAATAMADKQVEAYAAAGDASVKAAEKQTASATKSTAAQDKSFGASETALVTWGKRIVETAGVVAVGSLYMAQKFEAASLRLQTQAGASNKELDKLREGALKMAGEVGKSPDAVVESLYHVVSSMGKVLPAAHRVNEELAITKIALEGAAIGGTNAGETTYALASAINALHEKAGDAQGTMAELNAIVGSGDMTMGDLLASLKSGLIPTAQTFGVSLQSVGAALAVMGDMGMRGAMAGTRLRMSIALIGAPAKQAADMLKAIGMSAGEVHARTAAMTEALQKAGLSTTTMAADLKKPDGLATALEDLKQHLKDSGVSAEDQAAIMVRAFGGGRMASTIDLLTQNVGRLGVKFHQQGEEVGKFSGDWSKQQETLSQTLHDTEGSVESLGVHIGKDLTPEAKGLLTGLKDTAEWLDKNKVAADALAVTITGVLGVAVLAFTVNKLKKMTDGLKEAGSTLAKLGGFGGGGGGASGAAGGVAGKLSGGIVGARGPELPGSIMNPIVVAIESGQYAGLGGQAAALGSEGTTAGKAAESTAAKDAVSASEGAGGAGILSKVVSKIPGARMLGGSAEGAASFGAADVLAAGGVAYAIGAGANAGIKAATEAITPGYLKEHSPAEASGLKGFGEAEADRLKAHAGAQGVTQALAQGARPNAPGSEGKSDVSKEYSEASRALITANTQIKSSQEQVNSLISEGKKGTPEYTKTVKELATEESQRQQALEGLNRVSEKGQYLTPQQKSELEQFRAGLSITQQADLFSKNRAGIEGDILKLDATMKAHPTAAVAKAIEGNYHGIILGIETQMKAGKLAVGTGMKEIEEEIGAEEKTLFGKEGVALNLKGQRITGGVNAAKHARGGLVQLGRQGEAGKDTIPLNAGGIPIMAGAGEQVAVFTRHQQKVANQALAPMGGLPGLFSNVSKPNYMAEGGFVQGPGTNYSVGEEPTIAKDLKRLGQYLHVMLEGISGYRTPSHSVEVGGFANDPHTRGEASDTLGTQNISSSILARFGLERPFPGAAEADHMQLLGSLNHPHGAVGGGGVAGAIAQTVAQIKEPKVSGSGVIAQIVQAALSKVTGAANSALGAAAPSGGASGGFGAPSASGLPASARTRLNEIAKAKGWSVPDWLAVIGLESGGNPAAKNASGAYGIGQALGSTQSEYPKMVSSSAATQIEGMAEYIQGRYHNPTAALAHEHAYHWYAEGGLVANAAKAVGTSGGIKAPKLSPGAKAKVAPKGHTNVKKGKNVSKGKAPSASFKALLRRFGKIPGAPQMSEYEKDTDQVASLANMQSILSGLEGLPDRNYILPENMAGLAPYLEGIQVNPWETTEQVQGKTGTTHTGLKEMMSWLAELPQNHLLSSSDAGLLNALGSGVTAHEHEPMGTVGESILSWEHNKNERLATAEEQLQGVAHSMGVALKKRMREIKQHEETELKRYTGIKAQIARLTTGSLQSKLHAAQATEYKDQLIYDAEDSKTSAAEQLAAEKAMPKAHQNATAIAGYKETETHMAAYIKDLRRPAGKANAAYVALEKNILTNELTPIERRLQNLGGSGSSVGKAGLYGEDSKLVSSLESIAPGLREAITTERGTTIPTLAIELEKQKEENQNAGNKPAPEVSATTQAGALENLYKEMAQQANERAAVQGAQLRTLTNFIPQIPHFDKGGPVVDDGLIFAHKGEHVVPVGGTLAVNSTAPDVHNHISVNGPLAPLLEIIDQRVQHPTNVKGISRQISQRGNLLSGRV